MEPQVTAAEPPMKIRIADELRIRIERGELLPDDSLPPLHEICKEWSCSTNVAREAIGLLKQQGLITGGRGKAPKVRARRARVVRSSERHQEEKDLVLAPEDARRTRGLAEMDMGTTIEEIDFRTTYKVIDADDDIADALRIGPGDAVLSRIYEHLDMKSKRRRAWSVSYIPHALIKSNPAILDDKNEPWPGGTQHQLYTVGVEIARVVDEVTARMPTTAEAHLWDLDDGVPLLRVRRISIDVLDRVVEVSDADFPADRTELKFVTPLTRW